MQYISQSFRIKDPEIKDLFLDIGAEELSHMEMVIDGENGYLFKPSNVEDLIKKIKMLDDDTLVKKMGQASRKRLESRFAPQTHYEELMKIFNEAVKSRK